MVSVLAIIPYCDSIIPNSSNIIPKSNGKAIMVLGVVATIIAFIGMIVDGKDV